MSPPPPVSPPATRVLCLGDPLVELIGERWVQDPADTATFVPHLGGAVANMAVVAAAAGAQVALAGGAGADRWGQWLLEHLERQGVDTSLFALSADLQTPLELVTVDPSGEPRRSRYGDAGQSLAQVLGQRVDQEVRRSAAVLIGSDALVGADDREVTMRVREAALELERPVILDAGLSTHRWRTRADAAASVNACLPRALLVRASAADAAVMTGEEDPEAAASALVKAGVRLVVLTLGSEGAILRGDFRAQAQRAPGLVLSTIGAGDVLTGILVAKLAESRFYPPAVAAVLPSAVAQAARAYDRWGSLD